MSRILAPFFVAVAVALNVLGWWWFNLPVPVPLSFGEPFASVSFAPYRGPSLIPFSLGTSPLDKSYPSAKEIESDLASLKGVAKGVRTYTSLEGMDVVPATAGRYGLEVTHSAWLGVKLTTNEKEVEAVIEAANKYPDTIKRVIVGNEVLLREDLTPEQLIGYIRQVRKSIKQPVSYADVWAFWLKHPELANEVDFITIHILPYWEDEPVSVDEAAEHLVKIYKTVQQAFPNKPILIGESGWPTRGRDRGPAVANMVNGARFVRTLAKIAKEHGFDYNVVEAFDQPWKAKMEGTVGANWGVVNESRHVKYLMSGPVEPNPGWPWQAGAAAILGGIGAIWYLRQSRNPDLLKVVLLAGLSQVVATLTVWQAVNAWWLAYSIPAYLWAIVRIVLHAGLAAAVIKVAGGELGEGRPSASRWGERLLPLFGMAAIASTFLLLVDGRYRDIPNLEFLVPCLGVLLWGVIRWVVYRLPWQKAFAAGRLFAGDRPGVFGPAKSVTIGLWLSVLAAPLSEAVALARGRDFIAMHPTFSEQLPLLLRIMVQNREMLVWSVMALALSLPFLADWRLARKEPVAD